MTKVTQTNKIDNIPELLTYLHYNQNTPGFPTKDALVCVAKTLAEYFTQSYNTTEQEEKAIDEAFTLIKDFIGLYTFDYDVNKHVIKKEFIEPLYAITKANQLSVSLAPLTLPMLQDIIAHAFTLTPDQLYQERLSIALEKMDDIV